MIVAVDTNCILPGRVGGIENYAVALVQTLQGEHSPADGVVLLTRPENHARFTALATGDTRVVLLDRPTFAGEPVTSWDALVTAHPADGRRALAAYQARKANVIHGTGADVVHFPGNAINPLDLGLPTVLNLHDLQHRHYPQYFTAGELANRERWWTAAARRADALVAASDYVRDDLVAQLGVDAGKVFVTPDPLEAAFDGRRPPESALAEVRERLALPPTFLLYPAAVWPHKNHEALIRAFVAADVPEAQLVLTGGGQPGSNLFRLVRDLNAGSRVRLLGRVETADLVGLYHLAAGLVLPSRHESWSIPVAEAMACGCPVACSNVTSLPEQVGDAGLLFHPDDEAGMCGAIRALATNADLRRTLAARGRARAAAQTPASFARVLGRAYAHARGQFRFRRAA